VELRLLSKISLKVAELRLRKYFLLVAELWLRTQKIVAHAHLWWKQKPVRGALGLPWLVWMGSGAKSSLVWWEGWLVPFIYPSERERGRGKRGCSPGSWMNVDESQGQWPISEPDGLERCHLLLRGYHMVWPPGGWGSKQSPLEMCPHLDRK
jgi:hypothetical protein